MVKTSPGRLLLLLFSLKVTTETARIVLSPRFVQAQDLPPVSYDVYLPPKLWVSGFGNITMTAWHPSGHIINFSSSDLFECPGDFSVVSKSVNMYLLKCIQ